MSRKSANRTRQPQRKRSVQPSLETIPEQSSPRSRAPWPWVVVALLILLIGIGCWHGIAASVSPNGTSATNSLTTSSDLASPWKTLQTFSGPTTNNTDQKLQQFKVSGDWQITWVCQGVNGVDEDLLIAIYNGDGTLYNAGAQLTCLASKQIVGSLQETKSGAFYLVVNASTSWKITIQVPS